MMNKIKTFLVLILASTLLLNACSIATPSPATLTPAPAPSATPAFTATPALITATDGLGKIIVLQSPAQRIVSLAPSNTEILFAIGAGSQVVGRDSFSDFPVEAQQLTDIGGGYGELDLETIVSLKPDLVMAAEIYSEEQLKPLTDLGLVVYWLGNPDTIDGMYDNLRSVARLTGREQESAALIQSLQARVETVTQKVASVPEKPLVFYELDGTDVNAPWTAGKGTFIDTLISMAGGQNLGNMQADAWAQISLEILIQQDPQMILLGDSVWGGVTAESVAARAGWDTLSAVKENRVYPFDDNLVSRPGPRMVAGLEALARLLHPDLFK